MCRSIEGDCRATRARGGSFARDLAKREESFTALESPRGYACDQFSAELLSAAPHEIVKITCIDWRAGDRGAYLLTSAGAVVHAPMLADLGLILHDKKILLLQGHSDCAKSKAECPQVAGESDAHYAARVDEWTLSRLWRSAEQLLGSPVVQEAILNDGLRFCVAFHDVGKNEVEFFERTSAELVRAFLSEATPNMASAA